MRHAPTPDTPTPVYVTCPHPNPTNVGAYGPNVGPYGPMWGPGPRAPGRARALRCLRQTSKKPAPGKKSIS